MENRKLIYLFGAIFSILFAAFYFLLFDNFITNDKISEKSLYYNQVGLYKSSENSEKSIENLKVNGIEAYPITKDELIAVVCGMSEQVEETKAQQDTLQSLGISFVEKNIVVKDSEMLSLLESKDYEKILEMIENESKGNESAGTTS